MSVKEAEKTEETVRAVDIMIGEHQEGLYIAYFERPGKDSQALGYALGTTPHEAVTTLVMQSLGFVLIATGGVKCAVKWADPIQRDRWERDFGDVL
jgi:hypothetical protein